MNQGTGKRRNTIDYTVRLEPRDDDMRQLLFSRKNIALEVSLYRVNKLTMQCETLLDIVGVASKRARANGAERDLCGTSGSLICPQFEHECSLYLDPNEEDGCLYTTVPVRIETTSLKMSRCEFVVRFTLKTEEDEASFYNRTRAAIEAPLLSCAAADSQPVFVVSKIRTPHHYRHDKSIAKLRDVWKRLESKRPVGGYTCTWSQQIQTIAKQLVETVQATETVDSDFAPIERRKRARETEMISLGLGGLAYGEFAGCTGTRQVKKIRA